MTDQEVIEVLHRCRDDYNERVMIYPVNIMNSEYQVRSEALTRAIEIMEAQGKVDFTHRTLNTLGPQEIDEFKRVDL